METQRIMGKVDKDILVEKFVYQLPILRAVLNMSQDDVGEIVGLSRQTYSSIETKKRKMTWTILILPPRKPWRMQGFFLKNLKMH